jgi:hypothetical protein
VSWILGLQLIWGLVLVGLLLRLLRASALPGTYPLELDVLLYAGQRLLHGQWLYQGLFTGSQPLAQILFAPSAWMGSIQSHRLLIFALNLLGGVLLGRTLRRCAGLGLIRLQPGSPLPFFGGVLFVTLSQIFPEGSSGHLHQFVNLFLVAALERTTAFAAACRAGRPLPRVLQLRSPLWRQLALIGLLLVLACSSLLLVTPPLLLVIALLLVLARQRARLIVPLASGMVLALALLFLPYLLLPQGPAHAWAGAVVLPIEWTSRVQPLSTFLLSPLARLLATRVDGLPLWLLLPVPLVGLARLVRRRFDLSPALDPQPPELDADDASARDLLLPGLALVFCLELLFTLQRGDVDGRDLLLTVPSLVLLITAGLAALELPARRWSRVLARLMLVGLSLIYLNNIFLVTISHTPRVNRLAQAVEADRSRVRSYLQGLQASERSFTAPQDVALQRQLDEPSATVGIGPSWSLNQQQLPPSAATRVLGLPTSPDAVCRQLTDRPTRQLVWMRTDPDGPNSLAFLQDCLRRERGGWRDLSAELGLVSGEYRLFIRPAALPDRLRPSGPPAESG